MSEKERKEFLKKEQERMMLGIMLFLLMKNGQ